MKPADLGRAYNDAVGRANRVDVRILALTISDQRNGYPTGGYDTVSGTTTSSSTEAAALTPDRANEALHLLGHLVRQAAAALDQIDRLNTNWMAPPRRAMCQHCGDPTGDRYRTHCRWCTEWLSRHGDLPTAQEIARKQAGGRNHVTA